MHRRGFLALLGGAALAPLLPAIPKAEGPLTASTGVRTAKLIATQTAARATPGVVTLSAWVKEGENWVRKVASFPSDHAGAMELALSEDWKARVYGMQMEWEPDRESTCVGPYVERARVNVMPEFVHRVEGVVEYEPIPMFDS